MSNRIVSLEEKLSVSPGHSFHRYSLAQAYFEKADYKSAADHFKKCVSTKPTWMMAHLFLAKCEYELGNIGSCKSFLEQTILLAKEQGHEDPKEEAAKLLEQCNSA